ncbi:MAG: hypothetical protein KatS3mg059_0828 [Thermomicrobiales bacterium]|nr:MAG: hypothetical protein KatS3mg059_0828 [Thermomicrobiales bacterium]
MESSSVSPHRAGLTSPPSLCAGHGASVATLGKKAHHADEAPSPEGYVPRIRGHAVGTSRSPWLSLVPSAGS